MGAIETLQLNTGNAKTSVTPDEAKSQVFWSNYVSNSLFEQEGQFQVETTIDLMGNVT